LPLGEFYRLRRDPLGFLLDGRGRFGDVFRFQVGPLTFHLVAHPDHVKHVLLDHQKNYPRSWYYDRAKVGAGEGLVTTEGAAWKRLRRMAQPAFHVQMVAALAGLMTETTVAMLGRWREHARAGGGPLDVSAEFMALALRIACRALMGIDLGGDADRVAPAVTEALGYVEHRLSHLLAPPPAVPTPRNLRFRRAMRTLDGVVFDVIARRRESPESDAGDLLSMLLAARDEANGSGLSDRELRDQVFTFLVAGYETTAVALSWTVALLDRHPEADRQLRDEVSAVLGGRTPTIEDLPRLDYTRRVVEEALRLYPPVYGLVRDAREVDVIGGFRIPARSMIVLSPYVTHRHPDFWPDPEVFDPDRFTPERSAGRPRFAWYPFLGGPHQCIGQDFAMMEATLVIAMLAQNVRLRLAPGATLVPKPMLSLRPRDGLPMTVEAL
jgi:cytochrome P450